MTEQIFVSFWYARLLRAAIIFMGLTVIMPVIWQIITNFLFMLIYSIKISAGIFLSGQFYMPALFTSFVLALVIAGRSATWGKVSWRFMLTATLVLSLAIDFLIRFFGIFGFGTEPFFIWILSWLITGSIGFGLLHLVTLDQRSNGVERQIILKAIGILLIYSIYISACYMLLRLAILYRSQDLSSPIKVQDFSSLRLLPFFIAALIIIGLLTKLFRSKNFSYEFLIIWPLGVIVSAIGLHFLIQGTNNSAVWLWFYGFFTILSIGLSTLSIILFNHEIPTVLKSHLVSLDNKKFAFIIFIGLALTATLFMQIFTILWYSFIFNLPSTYFIISQFPNAALNGIVFFALPCAIYSYLRAKISFTEIFFIAIGASFISSFLPSGQLGVSVGFLFDHLFWQMLAFGPTSIIGWYVLSRLPWLQCD